LAPLGVREANLGLSPRQRLALALVLPATDRPTLVDSAGQRFQRERCPIVPSLWLEKC
jgi:hypothetical protein